MRRSYGDWGAMLNPNDTGYSPYTRATNLLYGLREAISMLREEGLEAVFARHHRHGEATRRAVRALGLEILCQEPAEYSDDLTGVVMPDRHDVDHLRKGILHAFDMSPGARLRTVARK